MNHKLLFEETVQKCALDERIFTHRFSTHIWNERYRIEGLLGEGAQGSTLKALDLKTQTLVAIKVIDIRSLTSLKALELFERELDALKKLSHNLLPRFVEVLDDESVGARAVVMSLVSGISWQERAKKGPINESTARRVLKDVAGALKILHAEKLVHRDIKPANLLVDKKGVTRVVDLGGVGSTQSRGSTIVGTFGFMAPEQLYGAYSSATDFYGLGATVMSLCTGLEPEDIPRKGLEIDVDAALPTFSRSMRTLLKKLLKSDPDARLKKSSELVRLLEVGLEPVDKNIVLYDKRKVTTDGPLWPFALSFLPAIGFAGTELWLVTLLPTLLLTTAWFSWLLPKRKVTYDRTRREFTIGRKSFAFDDVAALRLKRGWFPKLEFIDAQENVLGQSVTVVHKASEHLATFAALLGFADNAALLGLKLKLKRGECVYVDEEGISIRKS